MDFVGYLLNSVTKSAHIGWELLKPVLEGVYKSFTDNNTPTQSGGKRYNKTRRRNKQRRNRRKHTHKST